MRRTFLFAVFIAAVVLLYAPSTHARGLYKGHGRISPRVHDNPWSVRLNGTLGIHGAYQATDSPYDPGFIVPADRWSDWKFGTYGSGGLEFNLGKGWSIEPYGLYRRIGDNRNFRAFSTIAATTGLYRSIDSRVYGAGVNFRLYKNWRGGAAYLGTGGGYAHGEAEWAEVLSAQESTSQSDGSRFTQQDSGDFHVMAGLDFHPASALSLGFELGWRWSGLDDFNEFEGGFAGVRLGLMLGDGDSATATGRR